MVRMRVLAGLGAALLLAAATGARADDATYPIKLDRPEKVGDRFRIAATLEETATHRDEFNGKEMASGSNDSKYVLEGTLIVIAVDAKGRETKTELTIQKLEVAKAGTDPVAVVEPGTRVSISYQDKKAEFTRAEGQLSADAKEALASLFPAPQSDRTEDDLFGTTGAKKAGDTWPVHSKAISEDAGGAIAADKITGKVTFAGPGKIGDLPALRFNTDVDATDLTRPDLGRAKVAHLQFFIDTKMPVDSANPSTEMTETEIRHEIFEKEINGGKASKMLDSKSKRTETRILLK